MKKLRIKIILELIIFIVLLVYPLTVKATDDTYTTASTINGIIIKWSYKLNDSNQIVDLKAINTNEIVGELTIPSTLDDKIVVA